MARQSGDDLGRDMAALMRNGLWAWGVPIVRSAARHIVRYDRRATSTDKTWIRKSHSTAVKPPRFGVTSAMRTLSLGSGVSTMPKKVAGTANVGRLSNYNASGEVEFARLTALFGDNNREKAMFTSIMR